MKELQLRHEELIAPEARYEQVLWAWKIPVHPLVYDSDFAYTSDFNEQVRARVPESIRKDIVTIEKMLEKRLGIEVGKDCMKNPGKFPEEMEYAEILSRLYPGLRNVNQDLFATGIALDPERLPRTFTPEHHPMDGERLKKYAFEIDPTQGPKIRTCYIHNYTDQGRMVELYLRNFAIVFNNLGLEKISRA
jgi:hypothetical protein